MFGFYFYSLSSIVNRVLFITREDEQKNKNKRIHTFLFNGNEFVVIVSVMLLLTVVAVVRVQVKGKIVILYIYEMAMVLDRSATLIFLSWLAFDTDFDRVYALLSNSSVVSHQIVNNCCKSIFGLSREQERKRRDSKEKWWSEKKGQFMTSIQCSCLQIVFFFHSSESKAFFFFNFLFDCFESTKMIRINFQSLKTRRKWQIRFHRVKVHSKTWYYKNISVDNNRNGLYHKVEKKQTSLQIPSTCRLLKNCKF